MGYLLSREAVPVANVPMLEAVHLTKTYGDAVALDDLTLHVAAGEIFALLGANGAGKTTTTNLFLGFVSPSAGEARVGGLDVTKHAVETRRQLAYLPERLALYDHLSGVENLAYFLALGGREGDDAAHRSLLERAGLPADAAARRVATYSKGMRQKVGIALALATSAKALILDEPLSGLDPGAASDFCARLRALRDDGAAILMATHDLFRARETADRVGVMRAGKMVAQVDTRGVTHQELERLYLDAVQA